MAHQPCKSRYNGPSTRNPAGPASGPRASAPHHPARTCQMPTRGLKETIPVDLVCRPGARGPRIVRAMRASEIRDLIRVKPVELDATRRRLSACHDIADLRATGRRLVPRPIFDYVEGG